MRELFKEGYCAIAIALLFCSPSSLYSTKKRKPTSFYFYTSQCSSQCPAHTVQRGAITITMTVRITTAHLTVNLCLLEWSQAASSELDPTISPKVKNQHLQHTPATRPQPHALQPCARSHTTGGKQSRVPPLRS